MTAFKGYGDNWGWHQDLYNKQAFVPNGFDETRDMEGGREREKRGGTRQRAHIDAMEAWHATLRQKIKTEPNKWIKTEHGYIPKDVPDALKKSGWNQTMYQLHIAELKQKGVIAVKLMDSLEKDVKELEADVNEIFGGSLDERRIRERQENDNQGFNAGPLKAATIPEPQRDATQWRSNTRNIVYGSGFKGSSVPDPLLRSPIAKNETTTPETADELTRSYANRDGLGGAVDTVLDMYELRMKTLRGNYEQMRRESEIAAAASTNQSVLQGMIGKMSKAEDTAHFEGGGRTLATFINKHLSHVSGKFTNGESMKPSLTKGEIEELRSHMENLVTAKKSDNERVMLFLNEMTSFMSQLMTLANNIQSMINEMRKSITQSLR